MVRIRPDELQTRREIARAEALVSSVRGLDTDQGADVLRYRAASEGVSLHAAALAVLATDPTDGLLCGEPSPSPAQDGGARPWSESPPPTARGYRSTAELLGLGGHIRITATEAECVAERAFEIEVQASLRRPEHQHVSPAVDARLRSLLTLGPATAEPTSVRPRSWRRAQLDAE